MTLLSRQPLRRQILAAAGLLVVLLSALIVWAGYRTWDERRAEVRDTTTSLAATVAASLDHQVADLQAIGTALGQHPAVRALDRAAAAPVLETVFAQAPLLRNIVLVDAAGLVVASAKPASSSPSTQQPVLARVLQTGELVVSGVFKAPASGRWNAVVAVPVRSASGSVAGALGLALDLDQLPRVFSEAPLPAGAVVTVVDGAGLVLARNVDATRYYGTNAASLLTQDGLALRDLDGVERIGARVPLERADWRVVVAAPLSSVQARVRANWLRNVLLLVVWLSVAFAVTLAGANYTSGGLRALRTLARRIADGNLDAPAGDAMPNLELSQLQEAFDAMARRLREARDTQQRQVRHERQMNQLLQSLQRQMLRQERLAAVGQLVSGVAHEINNPLQAILGSAEILQRHPDASAEARAEGAFVQAQAIRMREIVRSLSRFSDPQLTTPEPVDLRDVVAEVQQLRARELDEEGIALETVYDTTRVVHAGFADLTQVLLSLVINAEQALLSSGKPSPRIRVRLLDAGLRVRCEVADNGPGVRTEDEARLFQPFFTTRTVGEGTGLGLAISYGIVRSFEGTIGYFRNDAGGATFYFDLPAMMADGHGHDTDLLRRLDHTRI
ncbi:MAG: cache domain-containing protein [Vicinamibacterales bacterium]